LGEKSEACITTEYLAEALQDFSGYIAADELYDGPFCVLSIVDNRRFNRLVYDVLDHDPKHQDIVRFFRRFQQALATHAKTLRGITTDASPLYPVPVAEVFGSVGHQTCEFHTIMEVTKLNCRSWKRSACTSTKETNSKHLLHRTRTPTRTLESLRFFAQWCGHVTRLHDAE